MKTSASHSNLSKLSREQRLALYGLAAGAALAAGASSAQANLVTLDLTGLALADRTTSPGGALYFDVNAASAAAAVGLSSFGGADFRITQGATGPFASVTGVASGNRVQGFQEEFFKASRLTTSNVVSFDNRFGHQASLIPFNVSWAANTTGFIGLEFTIGTDVHFGWANITANGDASITLNALGYQSDPDGAAHVEPPAQGVPDQGSSLALLATGAIGLFAFRKHQRKAA